MRLGSGVLARRLQAFAFLVLVDHGRPPKEKRSRGVLLRPD
ncbi:MAG: hypothetical protein WAU77_08075 [Solirubrobacteraceae bacterium]